jgi:small-conductance mechanosensitive channel
MRQASPPEGIDDVIRRSIDGFLTGLTEAIPSIVAGVVFLVLAALTVKLIMLVVRTLLSRVIPTESDVYRQFVTTIVAVFLWFGVALSFLTIVGLGEIAAALGTASGFLALGVSYALSGMLADAVAGLYLLRDPDFNPGDRVTASNVTGEIRAIELRKTRFEVDGDTVVRANADIEKQWTKIDDEPE